LAVTVRPYTESDWPLVRDIYDLAKPDELRGALDDLSVIRRLEDDPEHLELFRESFLLVCEHRDEVLGFAGHKGNLISWMFVHPAHRRKGVATALLRAVLARLPGTATLNVAAANRGARALYGRHGFAVDREYVAEFRGQSVTALVLRREATESQR
jgi:GNAT superfamily N-acetyltransferase